MHSFMDVSILGACFRLLHITDALKGQVLFKDTVGLDYQNLHYPNPQLSECYYECRNPKSQFNFLQN